MTVRITKLEWDFDAWEDYLYWQKQDKKTLKRINALLCSDLCQAPISISAKRHFEKTLDNIVPGIATLLYVDWLPQCNGFAVSATISDRESHFIVSTQRSRRSLNIAQLCQSLFKIPFSSL